MKKRVVTAIVLILFLIGMVTLAFNIQPAKAEVQVGVAAGDKLTGSVSYEYYVVAGYEMEPVPPSPASSPSGFEFNITPDVFNFGNITKALGKQWLYEGVAGTPFGSASASVNITNLLGYDITVTNLTIEVTDGTRSVDTCNLCDIYFGNYSIIMADVLDPWDETVPPKYRIDECNYTTGEVIVIRDGDWTTMAIGIPYPRGVITTVPLPLMTNDWEGDAGTTGHVVPVTLAAGATLTEYFGIPLFGDKWQKNSQIDATFTLTLMYEYEVPESPEAVFDYTPADPLAGEVVTFDASDTLPNGGTLTSYVWDFGDGSSGTGMVANHTYTSAGAYSVSLNVTDSEGMWDASSDSVTVVVPTDDDFPWIWVGVGGVVIVVIVAAAVLLLRRK